MNKSSQSAFPFHLGQQMGGVGAFFRAKTLKKGVKSFVIRILETMQLISTHRQRRCP